MTEREFIETVAPWAQADWPVHQILPSLTLAQACLESAYGTSELAVNANALFGIKATGWVGKTYTKATKEYVDGQYIDVTADFRAYDSWQESLTDHGEFLQKDRYAAVRGETDYRVACQAIKDAGYATSPTYTQSLIDVIEENGLAAYDNVEKPATAPGRSPLAEKFIPADESNYTKDRSQYSTIKEITIHHMAGDMTIESLGGMWQNPARDGSSHYGVEHTHIGQYVDERDIAWSDGGSDSPHGWDANCRAVTIETANSGGAPDWPVADDTLATLIRLVSDIAKRNALVPLVYGKSLTWHSMYAATACPGPYLFSKLQYIVDEANKINAGSIDVPTQEGKTMIDLFTANKDAKLEIFSEPDVTKAIPGDDGTARLRENIPFIVYGTGSIKGESGAIYPGDYLKYDGEHFGWVAELDGKFSKTPLSLEDAEKKGYFGTTGDPELEKEVADLKKQNTALEDANEKLTDKADGYEHTIEQIRVLVK